MKKHIIAIIAIVTGLISCGGNDKPEDIKAGDSTSFNQDSIAAGMSSHDILFGSGSSENDDTPSATQAKSEEIINTVLNNRGGYKAIKNIKTLKMNVKMVSGDMQLPLVIYSEKPDKMRIEMEMNGRKLIAGMNRTEAWTNDIDTGKFKRLTPEQFDIFKKQFKQPTDFFISPLYEFLERKVRLEYVGTDKDGDIDAIILKVSENQSSDFLGGGDLLIFIDSKKMLDYKYMGRMMTKDGELQSIMLLKENKKVKSFLLPHLMENFYGKESIGKYILVGISINESIDPKLFEMPK